MIYKLEDLVDPSLMAQVTTPGSVALVFESAALAGAMVSWANSVGLGLSGVIALGEKPVASMASVFACLVREEQTRVVLVCLERITNPTTFLERAEALAQAKPVVVLKLGQEGDGEPRQAYGAAFARAGLIRVETLQCMQDLARLLDSQPLPAGDRVAVQAADGGTRALARDALLSNDLRLAQAEEKSEARLGIWTQALDAQEIRDFAEGEGSGPRVVCVLGGEAAAISRQAFARVGIPAFSTPMHACTALAAARAYQTWLTRPARVVTRFRVNRRRVERILRRHRRQGLQHLHGHLALDLLEAYGFRVPEGRLARSGPEAAEIAQGLAYPVELQPVSPNIPEGISGLASRGPLAGPEAVIDAFDLIQLRTAQGAPGVELEAVLVRRCVPAGLSVMVGMRRDAQFGPLLLFGLGGLSTEVLQDVAFHLAPITADEARQMLRSTRAWRVLQESGPRSGFHPDAVVTALQRISQLATDFTAIDELSIAPLVLLGAGQLPMVAAARVRLSRRET